jgi:hypothetical protein
VKKSWQKKHKTGLNKDYRSVNKLNAFDRNSAKKQIDASNKRKTERQKL